MTLHPLIAEITDRIRDRSASTRQGYLAQMAQMANDSDSDRGSVSCSNMAHVAAAAGEFQDDILGVGTTQKPNIGIISAYNDMLSAHQPFEHYPALLRAAAKNYGATSQVAGCVPAMCDGVTQGRPGMELSLFSRDVIAMSTAIGLSHNVYDGVICLGVCDKIIPGLVMGALSHGHLPCIFLPAGPMESGLPNQQKAQIRKAFARGEVGRDELLAAEKAAYHSAGTCTFYGTANSNQMLMEIMGLHMPSSAFIHPHSDLRHALISATMQHMIEISRKASAPKPLYQLVDERSFVNAIIGLLATGGSTNHTLHLPAMAAAAGIILSWEDFADLSDIIPLLARVYPNGSADVNQFHAAGGISLVMRQLLEAGLLDGSAGCVFSDSLEDSLVEPVLEDNTLGWRAGPRQSADSQIISTVDAPFARNGGLKMLDGNIGRGVIKISAVAPERHIVSAPAAIFDTEAEVKTAFHDGKLDRDVVVVLRGQGPKAAGMPELHSLTPLLSILQDKGYQVALVTDGRMSGASGSVPAAIHLWPEAADGGAIASLRDGDIITLDAVAGRLETDASLDSRNGAEIITKQAGFGRELFFGMRAHAQTAEQGGGINPATHFTAGERVT